MDSSSTVNTEDLYKYIDVIFEPQNILILIFIIIVIFSIFFLFSSKPETTSYSGKYLGINESNSGTSIIPVLLTLFIVVLIVAGLLRFFFGIDVILTYNNLFKKEISLVAVEPTKDSTLIDSPIFELPKIPKLFSQVFNIPGNNYNYKQAESLCKAYGADLASYSQLEQAYNNGADWCNYGWSQGQMAFFPTQQKTFDKLQKIKGHENDCGRPGINGGYMANPFNRYGVNCYGIKPTINDEEESLMKINELSDSQKINADANYWKKKIPDILISPFNTDTWSKI